MAFSKIVAADDVTYQLPDLVQAQLWGNQNHIINGAFEISQRGTAISGISADGTYTADRFWVERGGNINYVQGTSAGNPPVGFANYGSFVNDTASNPFILAATTLETTDSVRFAGKTATLSFYARANANTAKSKALSIRPRYGTVANTKATTIISTTPVTLPYGTSSSDWQRFSVTFTVPSNALTVGFDVVQDNTLTVGDGFHITGVQLELGPVATPFKRNGNSFSDELHACQRYCQIVSGWSGFGEGTTSIAAYFPYVTQMRVTPTVVTPLTNRTLSLRTTGGTDYSLTGWTATAPTGGLSGMWVILGGMTGLTDNQAYTMRYIGDGKDGLFRLEAEI